MIVDSVERLALYAALLPYAKELSARFQTRRTDGLPFEVRFKQYDTKPDEKRKFEVHRKTIDLMMCFEGEEIIHICPEAELVPGEPLPHGGDGMKLIGAPRGFKVTVKEMKVNAGAGFIVAKTGDIMTMPGLPKIPAAEKIDIDENGRITGLF